MFVGSKNNQFVFASPFGMMVTINAGWDINTDGRRPWGAGG